MLIVAGLFNIIVNTGDFCKTVVRPVSPQIGARIGQAATSKYKVEMTTYVGAGGSSKVSSLVDVLSDGGLLVSGHRRI